MVNNSCNGENNNKSYISFNSSGFRQLVNHVHVRVLNLDTSDDQLLGLLMSLLDVQRINLGCQMITNLI